jgi:hypothetical protein
MAGLVVRRRRHAAVRLAPLPIRLTLQLGAVARGAMLGIEPATEGEVGRVVLAAIPGGNQPPERAGCQKRSGRDAGQRRRDHDAPPHQRPLSRYLISAAIPRSTSRPTRPMPHIIPPIPIMSCIAIESFSRDKADDQADDEIGCRDERSIEEGFRLQLHRNESDQARGCNPVRMTVTSRRTAALDGRLLAAVRAWRQ